MDTKVKVIIGVVIALFLIGAFTSNSHVANSFCGSVNSMSPRWMPRMPKPRNILPGIPMSAILLQSYRRQAPKPPFHIIRNA